MNPVLHNRDVVARAIYEVTANRLEAAMSDPAGSYKHTVPRWEELSAEEKYLNIDYAIAAINAIQKLFIVT